MPLPTDPVIDVPPVDELPETSLRRGDSIGTADYLLNVLLRHDGGRLYADFAEDGGRWHLRAWNADASELDEVVAATESLGAFRAVLARFGAQYMDGQVYGGFTMGQLSHRGATHGIAIYMANDQFRGYWLRAYAARHNPTMQRAATAERAQ